MSIQVTGLSQLTELPEGSKLVVRMGDSGDSVTWVKVADELFTDGSDAMITATGFSAAIDRGNVYLPGKHTIGEVLYTPDNYFVKIIAAADDGWVMVKTDGSGRGRHTTLTIGEPLGSLWDGAMGDIEPMFDWAEQAWRAEQIQARLDQILSSGVVPAETGYTVTVEVVGNVGILPTVADAKRLVGDDQITVTDVAGTDVAYTKTLHLHRTARWGCACDQVTEEDLADQPGDVTSWRVVGCTPVEGVSEVHKEVEAAA